MVFRLVGTRIQKKEEKTWKDGKDEGLETHGTKTERKVVKGNYKDGKLDGVWTSWYENGRKTEETTKMEEINFKVGKQDGVS